MVTISSDHKQKTLLSTSLSVEIEGLWHPERFIYWVDRADHLVCNSSEWVAFWEYDVVDIFDVFWTCNLFS